MIAAASAPAPDGAGSSVSRPVWLAYGLPVIALTGPFNFVQFYYLNFATDVLLLAPAAAGIVLAGARVWDALSDPIAGFLSDRTRSRLGRRRPWMLAAAPILALAFVLLWGPPPALSPGALLLWIGLALLLYTTASTAWAIPHYALGAELGGEAARRRLFGLRSVSSLLGVAGAFGAMQLVVTAPDPRAAAAQLTRLAALVIAGVLLVPPLLVREPPGHRARGSARPGEAFAHVARNPRARRLLAVWWVDQMGVATQGAVAPYLSLYVLQRPDLVAVMPACFIVPMVLSVPFWIRVAGRYGSQRTWAFALRGAAVAYLPLFALASDATLWAGAALACAGFFTGCGGPLAPTLLARVVDEDERRTGQRQEGVFFAAWTLLDKCAGAFVVLVLGLALDLSGFAPGVEQAPAADFVLRACLSLLPALMFALGAHWLRGLTSDEGALET